MILVQLSDFTGQYQLARSNNIDPIIQSYIDREEKRTLYMLLGKELADLLIAYLATSKTPAITRFNDIIDPFFVQNNSCGWVSRQQHNDEPPFYESSGLKDLLICSIFYYYVIETSVMKSGQSGITEVKVDTANSSTYANVYRYAEQKWNKAGFDTWLAIAYRCSQELSSSYPEFVGTRPIIKYGSIF